jgi:hypothetical protein
VFHRFPQDGISNGIGSPLTMHLAQHDWFLLALFCMAISFLMT